MLAQRSGISPGIPVWFGGGRGGEVVGTPFLHCEPGDRRKDPNGRNQAERPECRMGGLERDGDEQERESSTKEHEFDHGSIEHRIAV